MIASLRSTWILLGALALGVALACGGDTEEAGPADEAPAEAWEPAPPAKAPSPPKDRPGWVTELPADFPADVPIYPGAEVVQARVSPVEGSSVILSVDDDAEKVASFYADGLAGEGWSTDIKTSPDGTAIFADKTERRVSTFVSSTDEGTSIRIIVVPMR